MEKAGREAAWEGVPRDLDSYRGRMDRGWGRVVSQQLRKRGFLRRRERSTEPATETPGKCESEAAGRPVGLLREQSGGA